MVGYVCKGVHKASCGTTHRVTVDALLRLPLPPLELFERGRMHGHRDARQRGE